MDQAMETRLKNLEAAVGTLQKELEAKDRRIQTLEDIQAIERLQCAYGYYLEHWMSDEIIDLFADRPETSATFVEGEYLGMEGVRRYFGKMKVAPPSFLHMVAQINPVITIEADGKTAKGRWYGYGTICAAPAGGQVDPTYMCVVYEMVYVKENGVWKILKLAFQMHYAYKMAVPPSGKVEDRPKASPGLAGGDMKLTPDIWPAFNSQYPSGYIYPMHFMHPVTGKETQENAFNAQLELKPSMFQPK
jgi:hypothetical protein